MGENLWSTYTRALTGGERQVDIATKSGVSQAAVSRWLNGVEVPDSAPTVAAFARAHQRNPLEAFVAAGMLDEVEAGRGLTKASRDFLARLRASEDAPMVDQIRSVIRRGRSSPLREAIADEDDAG